ncbi:MAG: VPA1262 family N-terminal domain-containing protein [Bacteroidota bacterium]
MTILRQVSTDYEKAEVTCLFLHNRQSDSKTNLITIFELVPSEQLSSTTIGDRNSYHMFRESINDDYTLYITRLIDLDVSDVLDMYENVQGGFYLKFDNLDAKIEVQPTMVPEPPYDNPLLISLSSEKTLGRILPKRNSAMRVWSKLNTDKSWLEDFNQKFFEKLSSISRAYLGYDLATIPEHIGNVYLCACNPILRGWNSSLLDEKEDLLVSFHERHGKSIIGCKLVIEEERAERDGFTLSHTITSNRERMTLPYFPNALHKKLYDQNGYLVEHQIGVLINIQLDMNIQENVLNLKVKTKNGEEVFSVPKTTQASTTTIGNFDHTNAHYLKNALDARKFEELERNKEFIFFQNEADSKKRAQAVVRELLNKSKTRCMILDPYFGAGDLVYAITIQNISIPVQIISSVDYLERSIKSGHPKELGSLKKLWLYLKRTWEKPSKGKTYAHQLQEGIQKFKKEYSQQTIECRVLKGNPSPLHDRYIVVDEEVYLLGSSLNEFGARATTIIKVPTPRRLIDQADAWWADNERCPMLKEYLGNKAS